MNSLTETEAKTKWCPAARGSLYPMHGNGGHIAVNRNEKGEAMGPCIASLCMWWRWDPDSRPAPLTQAEKVAAIKAAPPPPTRGYCGAAGR